jgi:hypothetical protein
MAKIKVKKREEDKGLFQPSVEKELLIKSKAAQNALEEKAMQALKIKLKNNGKGKND